ncbi:tripartite tricarboxylate transporter substrate binding protein [Roseomonas sp. 18066]|uniref:Bug family tripartite tricarboxylate transporter substrate binding protein n=1 Tax=Roseomonas sp. 18066 TaxID=2681412 RepID=UPI00135ABACE|nr:tripartite tricarboxylate transporter substrate binding protein [Roseomonas sp. 18066]
MIGRRSLLAAPALLAALPAAAAWPERPLRIIVPFPPGSITDAMTRTVAEALGQALHQPVVVENRAGGNGVVGTQAAIQAPADGSVLLAISVSTASLNPHVLRALPYDPLRDLAPVGYLCDCPYMLAVTPGLQAANLAQLLEIARARPGQLTYSYGNQSAMICSALLAQRAGVQMLGVPYRGGAEALTDVVAGRITTTFTDFVNGPAQLREGRIKAFAVTSGQRFALAPDTPAVAETLPGYDLSVWFGLAAPRATPEPVIARANAVLAGVLAQPALRDRLALQGLAPRSMGPAEFGAFMRRELDIWGDRVRRLNIEPT